MPRNSYRLRRSVLLLQCGTNTRLERRLTGAWSRQALARRREVVGLCSGSELGTFGRC